MYDLMRHGDQSVAADPKPKDQHEVTEGHWFALVRRYVRIATPVSL